MKDILMQFKKATVTLDELEKMAGLMQTYEQFAKIILELQAQNYLVPVKSSGQTYQKPTLFYKYKIRKHHVKDSLRQMIEQLQLSLQPQLSLDAYYRLTSKQLEQDLPYIRKVNDYIFANGFPDVAAPASERSQQLVGDEKWIQFKNGRRVLERLNAWQHMLIVDVKEPLRFALNPHNIQRSEQYHLIVENKTTYEGLQPALAMTKFTTLIYGAGFEIVGSISLFEKQLPLPNANHHFYYFGDIDFAGVTIWYLLQNQQKVYLAQPFYEAAIEHDGKLIKKKQYRDEEALQAFFNQLPMESVHLYQQLLEKNYYMSQEVLVASQLQGIWLKMSDDMK